MERAGCFPIDEMVDFFETTSRITSPSRLVRPAPVRRALHLDA